MIRKTAFAVCLLTLLFSISRTNLGQDRSSGKPGCALLDNTRRPQFITYETRVDSNLRLRLRNNTTCVIVVETDDHYPIQLTRLQGGGGRIEAVTDSRDGIRLPLHYLIQNRKRREALRPAYGWGDSVFTYEILSGQSILFDVPAVHFRRKSDIAVPFAYLWEGRNAITIGPGAVAHRVYFLFEDLRYE
jgi:hypothetical protein